MNARAHIAKAMAAVAAVAFSLCLRAASYEVVSEADAIALTGAAGGDEIRKINNGDGTLDIVHIFNSTNAAALFRVPATSEILPGSARVLVVGGGGSGGADCGGGGGAGGYVYKDALTLSQGSYTINVGAGGAAVLYDAITGGTSKPGNIGGDSSIVSTDLSITAYGGGGGGSWSSSSSANSTNSGSAGGSSGGACGGSGNAGAALQPSSASGGLGNKGGAGFAGTTDRSGGGGGAGGPGVAATGADGGDGGLGVANEISGESVVYAAGGGGNSTGTPGKGGGDSSNTYGDAGTASVDGYAALDGTGSGGGGGGRSPHRNSGSGGSGVVIVRYTVQPPALGATVTTVDGEKVYSFTGTGSSSFLTLPGLVKADILVVGGGGAGANPGAALPFQGGAGGGGAGGMIVGEGVYLEGGTYTITVGKGGVNSGIMQGAGANGEASTVVLGGTVVYEAFGGGGGGILGAGNAGGSGGGGSMAAGGVGVDGQGYAGGQGSVLQAGGGGGGAAAGGGNATVANTGGAGGAGKACSITGAEVIYAAGGGGGTRAGTAAAVGGSGIGGNGGYSGSNATAGKDGTGSGGGGGRLNGAGGAGGSGIVIIRIKAVMPAKPKAAYEFVYDGNEHTLYEGAAGATITDGDGNTLDKIAVKDVGTYNYTVSLADGWKWADGSDNTPVNVTVTVKPPALTVESITITGWQVGQTPTKPVVVTSPFQLKDNEYTVVYAASQVGPWSAEPPTAGGTCWVTIQIPASDNYTSPAQTDIPKVSVELWELPSTEGVKLIDSLGYHVELTIKHEGAALTNFPMLVKFSENSPEGFEYKYANPDGSDIRFYAADGTQLAFEVDTWNPEGESLFWVKVPVYENGAVITAWWGELVDKEPDALIDSKEVWSEFLGVWHLDDALNSLTGTSGTLGTSNQTMIDGVVGKASGKTNKGASDSILTADTISNQKLNELNGKNEVINEAGDMFSSYHSRTFTASYWIHLNGDSYANAMIFSRISSAPPSNASEWDQNEWGLALKTANNEADLRQYLKDGGTVWDSTLKPALSLNRWYRMDVVFDDAYDLGDGDLGRSTIWIDGKCVLTNSVSSTFSWCTKTFRIGRAGSGYGVYGHIDEMRIRRGTSSADWIKAEYEQVRGTPYETTRVLVTPGAYFKNRWLVEPSISKTEWMEGEIPAEASAGEALYGEAYYTFESVGVTITNEVPTAMGGYVFKGVVDALTPVAGGPYGYEGLMSPELDVGILNTSPYDSLKGTASGRVLLANDHGDGEGAITGQAYSNTDPANGSGTYWVHTNDANIVNAPYMSKSTESYLMSAGAVDELCGATTVWHLQDTRIGNLYRSNMILDGTLNYLPWSTDAKPNGAQAESTHMVMRNIAHAAIYSPCYTNGIGTIYFDAVNSMTNSFGNLVVEICTNTTTGLDVPSDENIEKRIPTRWEPLLDEEGNAVLDENGTPLTEEIPGETNRYGYAVWTPIKVKVLKKEGSAAFNEPYETEEIALEIERGGSYENFYRVYAELNYTGPIRFRIRRTKADGAVEGEAGFILVDNVIVSYPSMRADLSSYGEFDTTKGGKNTLGSEGAFNVALPSVNDTLYGRGKVKYSVNNGLATADTSKFIISTRMFYRWRYLNQKVPNWKSVALNHTTLVDDGFKSPAMLDLDPNIPGDLEYYFVSWLNAPFYDYVDYSGMNLKLGGYYTENTAVVTNRFDSPVTLESCGTDWFVRLREGKSDYKSINLVVAEQIDDDWNDTVYKTNSIAMELVGKGVWRGVYQTLEANPNGVKFRIEGYKATGETLTDTGSRLNLETNNWYLTQNWNALPVSDVLTVEDRSGGNTNEYCWSSLPNDAVTGYLLFQLDDTTRAVTIVHADYQNFNAWNDANKPTKLFVGSSTEDETKTGASPKAISSEASFANWKDMPKSNEHWIEYFNTSVDMSYDPYVKFDTAETPNSWTAGPGMFVYANYRTAGNTKVNEDNTGKGDLTDYALQMQGNGLGYIQFVDATEAPRGLEEISFSARIGQFINFSDFAYYDSTSKISMSNYTVVTAGALDRSKHKAFRGNASLSIIAHYRPGIGCYEFRVEQCGAVKDCGPNAQPSRTGQRFAFYRWRYDSTGKLVSKRLGSETTVMNNWDTFKMDWPEPTATSGFTPMYFSVSNTTEGVCLAAGFLNSSSGVIPKWSSATIEGKEFNSIAFVDASDDKLTAGTYGFLTTNSEGCFARPVLIPQPVSLMPTIWNARSKLSVNLDRYTKNAVTFGVSSLEECYGDMANGNWYIPPGRMVADEGLLGIKGVIPTQTVNIYTAPAGTTAWTLLASKDFSSFGTPGARPTDLFKVYTTSDCSVKIGVGGTLDDARTDVVIDTIKLTQFRGGEWEDAYGYAENWQADNGNSYGGFTNFIFTTSWIENGAIKLSARQTTTELASSIRSPLYDGYGGRGIGLGMFSFNYKNAHPKANVLLQVATNITSAAMSNIDRLDDALWTTVTNFSFAGASEIERAAGTRSCYVGMHGVPGLMRIIMDPAVVAACQSEMDSKNFPQIYITDVFSRDEPALDLTAWWGWNLRTLGDESNSERRMYLYDLTRDLDQAGMSLALNNSTEADVDTTDGATYKEHQPFVQTPTFGTNVVGEVTFKARKYDAWSGQPAQVTLYGSVTGKLDDKWTRLKSFIVSNDTYSTYTYKTEPGDTFAAFRLGVTGVPGVVSTNPHNQGPDGGYLYPVRVLIDEVLVSEAIRASIAFRGVGAFRHNLDGTAYVPNVPSAEEQPLSGESWGVQCEIFAAQLEDEIDFERAPVVKLHWFNGEYPWGYDNWKTNAAAKSAVLARATGTNMIYRSSYRTAPDAIVPASLIPLETVQYELEVVYYTVGSTIPQTNYLSKAGTWFNPPWYKGIDKNAGKDRFSAYTILDTVAPGWAWFNEVNIHGIFDVNSNYSNTDVDYQYAEVAVPAEADITNWSIRFVEMLGNSTIITNTVATFGVNDLQATKPNLIGMASNMVYRVIANKQSRESGRLKYEDGTLDGVWSFRNNGYAMQASGTLWSIQPIGMQLVRSSGIIEHEIVLIGENTFDPDDILYDEYHPTNLVNVLNRNMKGSDFIYIGDDDYGQGFSLSVLTSRGEKKVNWFNDVVCTPGRINEGQQIDPDHPTPNGSSIIVYANLDPAVPHIRQTVGDSVLTNASVILVIPKGSQRGTNITYTVDKWYNLKSVTTNGVDATYTSNGKVGGLSVYTATVGVGASNNVTVVASAKLDDRLVDYGLTDDNKYRDAVIDWLEKGTDAYGNAWANRDSDEILLAEYRSLAGTIVTNLTLTQMYWLDMDPTVGDLALYGGMVSPPTPVTRSVSIDGADYVEEAVNFKVGVKLYITNTTDDVTKDWYNKPAWAPYVLRGRAKGETSLEYTNTSDYSWSNVTFKVTGFLNNGLNRLSNKDNWIPLRWFVFNEKSFDEDFTTSIEIKDPFGTDTPGYSAGWYDWYLEYGATPVFFSWSLDTRLRQFPVEALKEENHYDYE